MGDLIKSIIGGAVVLAIGGTVFTISQADVIDNFAEETGMTQQQAEEYVNNIPQEELTSFAEVGQGFIDSGKALVEYAGDIDCVNYEYEWEHGGLSCGQGKGQIETVSSNEIKMGQCLKSLDSDLGNSARSRISECIGDIDATNASYGLPVMSWVFDSSDIDESRNINAYNKSILRAALESDN